MDELIFVVEESQEGGFTARALGASIFTEAEQMSDVAEQVRDAVKCHFDDDKRPQIVRLHYVRDEVITV